MVGLVIIGAGVAVPSQRLGEGLVYFLFVSVFYHRVSGNPVKLLSREAYSLGFFPLFGSDLFNVDVCFRFSFEQ
jgi:hypothetical protein